MAQFATRRTAPKGAAQWIAATLATGSHPVRRAMESQHRLAAELLAAPAARAAADASDARAVQVSLVLLLAAHEDALPADSWRRVNPTRPATSGSWPASATAWPRSNSASPARSSSRSATTTSE